MAESVDQAATAVSAAAKTAVASAESAAVTEADSLWAKIKPYAYPAAGVIVGFLIGHVFK